MANEITTKITFNQSTVAARLKGNRQRAQRWLDTEVLKDCTPYVPRLTGALEHSGIAGTVIGSGEIVYNSPYARYQYYGKLMVDPETGKGAFYNPDYGFWSRPGVGKVLSSRNLNYSTQSHPKATRMWFEVAKGVNKTKWLAGTKKIGGGG